MRKEYRDTIKAYDRLGVKYFDDTSRLTPYPRPKFTKALAAGAKLLDAGCGAGRDAKFFSALGFEVVGVDLSKVMLKAARSLVPKARFLHLDVLDLKLPPKSFDAVWAQAVLLHLDKSDIPKALKNFYKVLKPGGLLHVHVKYGKGTSYSGELISGWHKRFYSYYRKHELEQLVRNAGFRVEFSKIWPDELKRPGVKWVTVWGRKP